MWWRRSAELRAELRGAHIPEVAERVVEVPRRVAPLPRVGEEEVAPLQHRRPHAAADRHHELQRVAGGHVGDRAEQPVREVGTGPRVLLARRHHVGAERREHDRRLEVGGEDAQRARVGHPGSDACGFVVPLAEVVAAAHHVALVLEVAARRRRRVLERHRERREDAGEALLVARAHAGRRAAPPLREDHRLVVDARRRLEVEVAGLPHPRATLVRAVRVDAV